MPPAPIVMGDRTSFKYYWLNRAWSALPIGGGGHWCANIQGADDKLGQFLEQDI